MKRFCGQLALLAFVMIGSAYAQRIADASFILEQAVHAEVVTGDIDQAILLYRQVAESASASRENVAKALVSLGGMYELIGSNRAETVFERVVSEFSDQPSAFFAARDGLIRISGSAFDGRPLNPVTRQDYTLVIEDLPAFDDASERTYDFSPDGSIVVLSAPALGYRKEKDAVVRSELYFMDVGSSILRPVAENDWNWEFQSYPRWSPDGRKILFTGHKRSDSGESARGLSFVELSTGTVKLIRTLGDNKGVVWMPNSKEFITLTTNGFDLNSIDGSIVRHYDATVNYLTQTGDVSSDGGYLLYHRVRERSEILSEIDIWMLDLKTGEQIQITDDDGFEGWPTWSQDGKSIFYASGSASVRNIFKKNIGSDSDTEKITSYTNVKVVFPRVLPEHGQLTFALMQENSTILLARTESLDSPTELVRGILPSLSPDGRTLYYLDNESGRTGIWSVSFDGQDPRRLVSGKVSTSYARQSFLSPEGKTIAYFLIQEDQTMLFTMPSAGGSARKLYTAENQQQLVPSWSPNGREIAFVDGPDLMVISSAGGDLQILASAKSWEGWTIEWSPDGSLIAGFGYLEGETENILFLVNRETKEIKRLTTPDESSYKEILDWHPDGDRISYMYYDMNYENDGSRIVPIDGGKSTALANMPDPMWDYMGIWGPDSKYYFLSAPRGAGGFWGLYSVDENTGVYETVRAYNGRAISLPSWDENGSTMVWSELTSSRQLWMLTDLK